MKKYLNGEVFVKFLQQLNSFWSVKPHHSFCWGKKSVCWKADRSSKEAEKCFATAGDKELWTIEEWKWKPSSSISFIRQTLKEFATNFHLKCTIHWNHHHVLTDKLSYNFNKFSHSFVKKMCQVILGNMLHGIDTMEHDSGWCCVLYAGPNKVLGRVKIQKVSPTRMEKKKTPVIQLHVMKKLINYY